METRARTRGGGAGGGGAADGASGSSRAGALGWYPTEGPPEDSDDDAPNELLGPLLEEWRTW
jgi:hypothetical protein